MKTEEKTELVTEILRSENVPEVVIISVKRIANDLRTQGAVSSFEESILTSL